MGEAVKFDYFLFTLSISQVPLIIFYDHPECSEIYTFLMCQHINLIKQN